MLGAAPKTFNSSVRNSRMGQRMSEPCIYSCAMLQTRHTCGTHNTELLIIITSVSRDRPRARPPFVLSRLIPGWNDAVSGVVAPHFVQRSSWAMLSREIIVESVTLTDDYKNGSASRGTLSSFPPFRAHRKHRHWLVSSSSQSSTKPCTDMHLTAA